MQPTTLTDQDQIIENILAELRSMYKPMTFTHFKGGEFEAEPVFHNLPVHRKDNPVLKINSDIEVVHTHTAGSIYTNTYFVFYDILTKENHGSK